MKILITILTITVASFAILSSLLIPPIAIAEHKMTKAEYDTSCEIFYFTVLYPNCATRACINNNDVKQELKAASDYSRAYKMGYSLYNDKEFDHLSKTEKEVLLVIPVGIAGRALESSTLLKPSKIKNVGTFKASDGSIVPLTNIDAPLGYMYKCKNDPKEAKDVYELLNKVILKEHTYESIKIQDSIR